MCVIPVWHDCTIDDTVLSWKAVAHKVAGIVYQCLVVGSQNAMCRKIDMRLRKYSNDYDTVFIKHNIEHHCESLTIQTIESGLGNCWVWYSTASRFLFSKLDSISFDIDEVVTIVDANAARIHKAFEGEFNWITRTSMQVSKNGIIRFVSLLRYGVEGDKQWYTSVMLNKLMFCYFIQKKGNFWILIRLLRNNWSGQNNGEW